MRTGLIAQKMGMTRIFTEDGSHVPVTVLKVDNCQVVAVRTEEKDGYSAVQLGVGAAKVKNVTQPMRGHFAKAKLEPKRKLVEFRVTKDGLLEVGAELSVTHFLPGQFVDVVGTTKGRGFSGVIRRHNFSSNRASHGNSVSHNKPGSISMAQDPGRVFPGKKLPGQYGNATRTAQTLTVVRVDAERGLLLVKGAVPGAEGGHIVVQPAVKTPARKGA